MLAKHIFIIANIISQVGAATAPSSQHRPRTYRGMQIRPATGATTSKMSLTRPKDTWAPSLYRDGLTARQLGREEMPNWTGSSTWWIVEATMKYKGFTRWFIETVQRGASLQLQYMRRSRADFVVYQIRIHSTKSFKPTRIIRRLYCRWLRCLLIEKVRRPVWSSGYYF